MGRTMTTDRLLKLLGQSVADQHRLEQENLLLRAQLAAAQERADRNAAAVDAEARERQSR